MREMFTKKVGRIDYSSTERVRTYYATSDFKIEVEQTIFYYEDGHREKWYTGLLYHNSTYLAMTNFFNSVTELEKACKNFFIAWYF